MKNFTILMRPLKKGSGFVLLIISIIVSSSGKSAAQQTAMSQTVTLQFRQASLTQVLKEIERQTNLHFVMNMQQMEKILLPAISYQKRPVSEVLEGLLLPHHIGYKLESGNIVLYLKAPRSAPSPAPPIKVVGRVTDAGNGAPLISANAVMAGSGLSTLTDKDGRFFLEAKDSDAVLIISFIGYLPKVITVAKDTSLDIRLVQDRRILTQVTVEARRRMNNEAAALNQRRNAATIQDIISAENIAKTASITTTQALQRVTGVTVSDDKYVAIRGMGDRNVVAQLNGARLSAANSDRNSVPLDLVPAALLDNITVYKTVLPDMPADAPAGIVELKTKSIPDSMVLIIEAQSGLNTTVGAGGDLTLFKGADMGVFGNKIPQKDLSPAFLNLSKQYPSGQVGIDRLIYNSRNSEGLTAEAIRINNIMKQFDPVMTTSTIRAAQPNQVYTVGFGNTFHIFHGHQLGLILGGNYYFRSTDKRNAELNQYSIYQGAPVNIFAPNLRIPEYTNPNHVFIGKFLGQKENTGTEQLTYGMLAGLSYRFNPRNEVSVHYIGNRGAELEGTSLLGRYANTGEVYGVTDSAYSLRQTYRKFNTLQFRGEHRLGTGTLAPQFSWNISGSHATQDDPDFRYIEMATDSNQVYSPALGNVAPDRMYNLISGSSSLGRANGSSGIIDPNGRYFRNLVEDNRNYKADLSIPFLVAHTRQIFKIGGYYLEKKRSYTEHLLSLPPGPGASIVLQSNLLYRLNGNLDRLVGYDQLGIKEGFNYTMEGQPRPIGYIYAFRPSLDNYSGSEKVVATYGMIDARVGSRLRLAGGVRLESTDIRGVADTSLKGSAAYTTGLKPFYSASLDYVVRTGMHLRMAYATSLARPELRELVPILQYDPFQFAVNAGNPALKNQFNRNLDFRWDWFLNSGEILSASVFYKEVDHQLIKTFVPDSLGTHAVGRVLNGVIYTNDPSIGHVYGLEFEVRKDLGRLGYPFHHFFIGANLMLARSVIQKNPARLTASRIIDRYAPDKSPLFEQPPYSFNAYLNYDNPRLGTSLSCNYNVVGERLIQVNMDGTPDLYNSPAPVLDLVWTQRIVKRLQLKAFAKNLLDPAYREMYTNAGENGKYLGQEYIHRSYHKGAEYVIGLNYEFF